MQDVNTEGRRAENKEELVMRSSRTELELRKVYRRRDDEGDTEIQAEGAGGERD